MRHCEYLAIGMTLVLLAGCSASNPLAARDTPSARESDSGNTKPSDDGESIPGYLTDPAGLQVTYGAGKAVIRGRPGAVKALSDQSPEFVAIHVVSGSDSSNAEFEKLQVAGGEIDLSSKVLAKTTANADGSFVLEASVEGLACQQLVVLTTKVLAKGDNIAVIFAGKSVQMATSAVPAASSLTLRRTKTRRDVEVDASLVLTGYDDLGTLQPLSDEAISEPGVPGQERLQASTPHQYIGDSVGDKSALLPGQWDLALLTYVGYVNLSGAGQFSCATQQETASSWSVLTTRSLAQVPTSRDCAASGLSLPSSLRGLSGDSKPARRALFESEGTTAAYGQLAGEWDACFLTQFGVGQATLGQNGGCRVTADGGKWLLVRDGQAPYIERTCRASCLRFPQSVPGKRLDVKVRIAEASNADAVEQKVIADSWDGCFISRIGVVDFGRMDASCRVTKLDSAWTIGRRRDNRVGSTVGDVCGATCIRLDVITEPKDEPVAACPGVSVP